MPFVDDVSDEFHRFLDALIYDIIKFNAEALWWLIKSILILSYQIISVDEWLSQRAFPPLIQGANEGTRIAATMTFVIALMVLGLTYMLAVWIRLDVVSPRKAFLWFLAGALFFQIGPQLYQGFHTLRTRTASIFFMSGTRSILMAGGDPFSGFSAMTNDDPLIPYDLCDNRDPYFDPTPDGPGNTHVLVRGSDVTLAFLRATGYDVMGYAPPYPGAGGGFCGVPPYTQHELPQWWMENPFNLGGYFYENRDSSSFGDYGDNGRRDSIENAFLGLRRLMAAIPLAIMAVMEALVYLLLTVAEGMTFLSFSVAVVFSYFKRTEGIALSIIDLMIQLIIQTIAIGLFQALIMGFAFSAALSGNGYLMIGIGLLTFVLMLVLLWSGVRAVFNSFNRLFQTMGQAAGNVFITPTQGALGAAGLGLGAGLAAGGAGLMGASVARSAMSNNDQQPDDSQRAMRGSSNMMRASVYAMAAGTGNSRIMQAAHFSALMTRSNPPTPTRQTTSEAPTTMTQVPTKRLAAEVQSVGEELEQEIQLSRVNAVPTTEPRESWSVVRDVMNQLRDQRGTDAAMTPQSQINQMLQGAGTTLGRYIQQALQLGLTGTQAAGVLKAVQSSETRQLSPAKQQTLVGFVQQTTGQPREWVERDVNQLVSSGNAVPKTVAQPKTAAS